MWPTRAEDLIAEQERLAAAAPPPWHPPGGPLLVAGCAACFNRGHRAADRDEAWAAAVAFRGRQQVARAVRAGAASGPYEPGLLALREGPLLEAAVRDLPGQPDVVLVNAAGRDHPRHAGLALHLGAVLGIPSVGVTHRPLLAASAGNQWPPDRYGASAPLAIGGEIVGCWLRTRPGVRPLAVHAGWRTTPEVAAEVVLQAWCPYRTPEPIRQARRLARLARAT